MLSQKYLFIKFIYQMFFSLCQVLIAACGIEFPD